MRRHAEEGHFGLPLLQIISIITRQTPCRVIDSALIAHLVYQMHPEVIINPNHAMQIQAHERNMSNTKVPIYLFSKTAPPLSERTLQTLYTSAP